MRKRLLGVIAIVLASAGLSGCETVSVDTATTSSFMANGQADTAVRRIAMATDQFEAGNYGLAEQGFRQAVEATPDSGTAWLGLAASYDQLGRFELADRAYAQLVKLEGRKASILNNQGYSYILRGDMKKARKVLADARKLAPGNTIIEGNWRLANAG